MRQHNPLTQVNLSEKFTWSHSKRIYRAARSHGTLACRGQRLITWLLKSQTGLAKWRSSYLVFWVALLKVG